MVPVEATSWARRPRTAEVDGALERLYEFFVAHYEVILAMPRSFASVRRGLPLCAEPAELAHTVLSRLAELLTAASSQGELAERAAKYADLGYLFRALDNENRELGRQSGRLRLVPDLADEAEPDEPAVRPERDDRGRLRRLLAVLQGRARRPAPVPTCLTELHLRCWQAVLDGRGAQAALARELAVDPSRISQIKASARLKVQEAIYVAGVLGPAGALDGDERIERCLDAYDGAVLSPAERARLTTAAPTVRVHRDRGQRADPGAAAARYLRRRDKQALRAELDGRPDRRAAFERQFAEGLHVAESTQAGATGNPYPNCALGCSRHNPSADRVLLEIDWR